MQDQIYSHSFDNAFVRRVPDGPVVDLQGNSSCLDRAKAAWATQLMRKSLAGIRQPFRLAVVETVITALWIIPNGEPMLLMAKLFDELAKGRAESGGEATNHQRRRTRHNVAHPFYWGVLESRQRQMTLLPSK